jgi:phage baseplate assembly protein W
MNSIQVTGVIDTTSGTSFAWKGINWDPGQNTIQEVLQNVYTILGTPIGTQVLNRALGVYQDFIDKPQNLAIALVRWLFTVGIQVWEPRFTVSSCSFSTTTTADALQGVVNCVVTGKVNTNTANPYSGIQPTI